MGWAAPLEASVESDEIDYSGFPDPTVSSHLHQVAVCLHSIASIGAPSSSEIRKLVALLDILHEILQQRWQEQPDVLNLLDDWYRFCIHFASSVIGNNDSTGIWTPDDLCAKDVCID
eukprot:GILJ01006465.1.p1 GENE.GILJ01006465.1~~GILJ01006465.1.p1  ORF type:complete len:117 (+),score=11.96 GILJ01006465.1:77-427(+)